MKLIIIGTIIDTRQRPSGPSQCHRGLLLLLCTASNRVAFGCATALNFKFMTSRPIRSYMYVGAGSGTLSVVPNDKIVHEWLQCKSSAQCKSRQMANKKNHLARSHSSRRRRPPHPALSFGERKIELSANQVSQPLCMFRSPISLSNRH